MPGPLSARPHRTEGSWVPRLAGVGVIGVLAAGGLIGYLASAHHAAVPPRHRPTVLSSKVLKIQTVGIIDFGPDDDRDPFAHDADDHPLMLHPTRQGLSFVAIPVAELAAGVPVWTADQMADGSEIFIYTATGQCLTAHRAGRLRLSHCDLSLRQRWRPFDGATSLGQTFAKYASAQTGRCLTAPAKKPGPATLEKCGLARLKTQEIAFWWNA
ncbi:MAG TPA: hypothetical protein VMU94_12290 [Streptosporangiaceae bacterium]|nr:hypothetical protein [Streptosporangiaceae bacterium]